MKIMKFTALLASAIMALALMAPFAVSEAARAYPGSGMMQKHHGMGANHRSRRGNMQSFSGRDGSYGSRHSRRWRSFGFGLPSIYLYSNGGSGCGYSYRKWQSTGSSYWRSRYYDCRNG